MNKLLSILAVFFGLIVCCLLPVFVQAGEVTGVFSCSAGMVATHEDFGRSFDLDERFEIGVMCEAAKPSWPVGIVAGYSLSFGHSKEIDVFCTETRLGLMKVLALHPALRPYISGGFNSLNVYADIPGDDDNEGTYGTWYGAGVGLKLTDTWHLNLGWRRSRVNMKLFGERLHAGGDHFDWAIGYRFPRSQ